MCGRLNSDLRPGEKYTYRTSKRWRYGKWGFSDGKFYNARRESLNGYWKSIKDNKAVVIVDSFWEKDGRFTFKEGSSLYLGAIFNKMGDFAIITTPSKGLVKEVHHRMPIVLDPYSVDGFLNGRSFEELDINLIKRVA